MMKFAAVLTTVFIWPVSIASAQTSVQMDAMRSCMSVEKHRSDASRSGVSALDFCAAEAIVDAPPQKNQSVDIAIDWLKRKQATDPVGSQAAMDACRTGAGQTYGQLLSCMVDILGP